MHIFPLSRRHFCGGGADVQAVVSASSGGTLDVRLRRGDGMVECAGDSRQSPLGLVALGTVTTKERLG